MNIQPVRSREVRESKEQIIYLSLLLTHVKERLLALTPGINCSYQEYATLTKEKTGLTLAVNKAKLKLNEHTFVEEINTVYGYNSIILMLGGTFKQRFRT